MDFAALAVFRAVAREQSITRAAERLGRVPSNVTTRIQQIEEELGVPLFLRERKRMVLTQAGRTYLDYAERILNLAEEAAQIVNPAGPAGVLRIGSMECTVASRLPVPLARFNAQWPDVTIDLSTAPTRQLVEALLAHRIDCALVAIPSGEGWPEPGELVTTPLFGEDLVLLLPPGHPEIAQAGEIRPRALAAFSQGCTYRALAETWLAETWLAASGGDKPRFAIHDVRSYHAMFACTLAGACFSVMPRSVLELMPSGSGIVEKPLLRVDTHLACRPGFSTPAFAAFRDTLLGFADLGGPNGS